MSEYMSGLAHTSRWAIFVRVSLKIIIILRRKDVYNGVQTYYADMWDIQLPVCMDGSKTYAVTYKRVKKSQKSGKLSTAPLKNNLFEEDRTTYQH